MHSHTSSVHCCRSPVVTATKFPVAHNFSSSRVLSCAWKRSAHQCPLPSLNHTTQRLQRRSTTCCSKLQADVLANPLPVFTCSADEVLAPGTTRVLQVYETKQLRLLEDVMVTKSQLMGYFVREDSEGQPSTSIPGHYSGPDYTLCLGNLVKVQEVRRIQVGAIVRLQSEARVQVEEVTSEDPLIRAKLASLPDNAPSDVEAVTRSLETLREVLKDAQNLSMKFKGEETANLQAALYWVDNEPLVRGLPDSDISLETAYRLSFAALQLLPEMSSKEQFRVVQKRIAALETFDTALRVQEAEKYMSEARSLLAAKVALKTLGM